MTLNQLATRYIASTETVLREIQIIETSQKNMEEKDVRRIVDHVKAYLEDAKYYKGKKRFEVSLASVAYCEGLLDALRMLGAVKFEWPAKSRKEKRRIVLASGVFDLLHLGHVRFLEEAKKAGGENAELIVIVARDGTVKKRKGKEPVVPESQRRALVESLKVVDEAILGYESFDVGKVVEKIRPDVIAVGYDQDGMEEIVRKHVEESGLKVKVVRIGKFEEDELDSSSKIKQKIVEDFSR
ncbi:MAG: DUF357 domain-containing protein [Candidatus Bathycorpusculaceae bacterium]